ncbi:MAG: cytochrome c oxidase subunit 2 [Myxococcota bacterium]|jgi:cytochrome c oxidase subunit 2
MLSFFTSLLLHSGSARAADEAGTFWMPPQASTFAADVDFAYYFIYWIDVVFFIVLMGAMLFFAVQYRQKKAGEKTLDLKGSHAVELAWAVLPSFLLIAMFFLGFQAYMKQTVPPANALNVRVQAQKWQWNYSYPELGIENTSVLVVPQGTPVVLTMSSKDVLHSFFVPDFRIKKDVVPGRYTVIWFEVPEVFNGNSGRGNMPVAVAEAKGLTVADDAGMVHTALDSNTDGYTDGLGRGEHQVFCTEYCGTNHSRMYSRIKVLPQDEFDAWVTAMTTAPPLTDPVARGERTYKKYGCAGCHSIDGSKLVGPTFQGVWGRQENITGQGAVTVDESYIQESIWVPGAKVVEGYANQMPSYKGQLEVEQIDDVIAYLKTLQ